MRTLQNELLTLDSETYWTGEDLTDPAAGQNILQKFLRDVLGKLISYCPNCHSAYIAVAGIVPEEFAPLAAVGRDANNLARIHRSRRDTSVASFLNGSEIVSLSRNVHKDKDYKGNLPYCDKLLIQLRGYGELYGFVSLDADLPDIFTEEFKDQILQYQPLLSRICADAVFSMRLRELAVPFESAASSDDLQDLYQEIADRTLRVFAADGVVLRIYDRNHDRLEAEAYAPVNTASDEESIRVAGILLSENSVGEEICRLVYKDPDHTWTVGMLEEGAPPDFSGAVISKEMEDKLRDLGIKAYCVFQLTSEMDAINGNVGLGTLAFYHRHPHRYSWRDISLSNSLCQRAADTIALYNKTKELRENTERMFLDGQLMTRVEIVTLLAHDLGHKAFSVRDQLEQFIADCKKAIREGRPFPSIKNSAYETLEAANALIKALYSINSLFKTRGGAGAPEDVKFKIIDVAKEIHETLKDALARNKCLLTLNIPENLTLFGNRGIFLQALFNLILNAIDAQRSRRNPRNNNITLSASNEFQREGMSIIVKIWDEGPGINQSLFPDPAKIFELGVTSKTNGTGRGLTISRSLLGNFFGANLRLEDPRKAMFKITFPLNLKGQKP